MSYLSDVTHAGTRARRVAQAIEDLTPVFAEAGDITIAVRGMSGATIGAIVAHHFKANLLIVRKGEACHSTADVERDWAPPGRYIIIDDFIDSGRTLQAIEEAIRRDNRAARCLGWYLYAPLTYGRNKQHWYNEAAAATWRESWTRSAIVDEEAAVDPAWYEAKTLPIDTYPPGFEPERLARNILKTSPWWYWWENLKPRARRSMDPSVYVAPGSRDQGDPGSNRGRHVVQETAEQPRRLLPPIEGKACDLCDRRSCKGGRYIGGAAMQVCVYCWHGDGPGWQ